MYIIQIRSKITQLLQKQFDELNLKSPMDLYCLTLSTDIHLASNSINLAWC